METNLIYRSAKVEFPLKYKLKEQTLKPMRKHLRWVLHWLRPLTQNWERRTQHVGNTNMLVSKNAKICVTPNPKPQHESVEYGLCWVPNATFSRWHCTSLFVGVDFIHVGFRFSVEYGLNSALTLTLHSTSLTTKPESHNQFVSIGYETSNLINCDYYEKYLGDR